MDRPVPELGAAADPVVGCTTLELGAVTAVTTFG